MWGNPGGWAAGYSSGHKSGLLWRNRKICNSGEVEGRLIGRRMVSQPGADGSPQMVVWTEATGTVINLALVSRTRPSARCSGLDVGVAGEEGATGTDVVLGCLGQLVELGKLLV
jgi:hypothetical protein